MQYDGDEPDLGEHFAEVLRGLEAWRDGNVQEALDHLERGHFPLHWTYHNNPFIDENIRRWAMAEILRETGRYEEALRYYTSIPGERDLFGMLWLGPTYLRRGEVHEAMGNDAEAIDFYTRLIELWEGADEHLQPSVEEARAGIQRILDRQTREAS